MSLRYRERGGVATGRPDACRRGIDPCVAAFVGQTPPWTVAVVAACLVVRVVSSLMDWPLPPAQLKLVFLAAGVGIVLTNYGTLLGMEPGLAVLLILISLKLVETRTARDFQVIILLGYFLGLCDLFFLQDLTHWLYVGAIVTLFTAVLIHFHHGGAFRKAVRLSATMALQALPILILLYLFFPRLPGGVRILIAPPWRGATGMSDHMDPGSVSMLANDHSLAFRAKFPDGNVPAQAELIGVGWCSGEAKADVEAG